MLITDIEENLMAIGAIKTVIEMSMKQSRQYRELAEASRRKVNMLGLPFYWVYSVLKKLSDESESPMFGVPQLYGQWLKTIKSLKSENHSLFYNNNSNNDVDDKVSAEG